jgi:hypothetical protein
MKLDEANRKQWQILSSMEREGMGDPLDIIEGHGQSLRDIIEAMPTETEPYRLCGAFSSRIGNVLRPTSNPKVK